MYSFVQCSLNTDARTVTQHLKGWHIQSLAYTKQLWCLQLLQATAVSCDNTVAYKYSCKVAFIIMSTFKVLCRRSYICVETSLTGHTYCGREKYIVRLTIPWPVRLCWDCIVQNYILPNVLLHANMWHPACQSDPRSRVAYYIQHVNHRVVLCTLALMVGVTVRCITLRLYQHTEAK